MKVFSQQEIDEYINYTDENVIPVEEIMGQCFICGRILTDVELPKGPEKRVTCLEDRDYFVELFEELIEMGEM